MHQIEDMEFLPILKNGKKVYAGFWKRFCAAISDMIVYISVAYAFYHIQSINIDIAIVASVILASFFPIYSFYFNLKYGGTLGKLAVGIRVTKPNGKRIGAREALLRSIVDIAYGLFFAIFQIYAILQADSETYLTAGYIDRTRLLLPLYPDFSKYTQLLSDGWYWSEMIVLLLNKRKRALHDFIAGTVVIYKEFA